MQPYRFHIILSVFLFGVAVETLFSFSLPTITWLIVVFGAVTLLLFREQQKVSNQELFLVFCCISFSLGLLRTEVASWSFGHSSLISHIGKEITLEGVVSKEPDIRERNQHVIVETGEDTLLVTTDSFLDVSYGDRVVVTGEISVPERFTTELGREFLYDTYLLAKGIEYTMQFAEVEVASRGEGSQIVAMLLRVKEKLLEGIRGSLGEPQAGLGVGLLLGVKQALGDDLEQSFRTAGIIHIVVLSGYNIMLVVAFVMFVLSFFLQRRLRIAVGITAIVGFALIVGLSATVVRASVMAALLLIAQALGRTYDVTRALLFAGTVMVCLNPYLLLYDIGFQLSFMATLGLIILVPRFEEVLASRSAGVTLREYLLATVATQIAVLPLLMYHIGEVSLIAVVVNLLVLPIVPLAMLATFGAGVVTLIFPAFAVPFAFVAHYALLYIIETAVWFSSVPFAAVTVPAFSVVWVPVMYGAMVIVYVWLFHTKRNLSEVDDWLIEDEKEKIGDSLREPPITPVFFR